MAIRVSNNFRLQAMINGKTLMAGIRLVPGSVPLVQALNQNYEPSPSWENGGGPKFYAWVRDTDGVEYTPSNLALVWNGTEINASNVNTVQLPVGDGTSKTGVIMIGLETILIDGVSRTVTVFSINENVFGANNLDSDTFYIKGQITLAGGRTQEFVTDTETARVRMYNTGDKLYEVEMAAVDADDDREATVTARLLDLTTGQYIQLPAGSVTFYNLNGTGDKIAVSGVTGYSVSNNVLTVNKSVINGFDNFAAKVVYGGDEYWGTASVRDLTDHIYVTYDISGGVVGEEVEESGVANVAIYISDKDGNKLTSWGGIPSGSVLRPNVVLKMDDGTGISLSTDSQPTTPSIQIYSGTYQALEGLSVNGSESHIYFKSDNWKALLRVTYKALMEAGGSIQGWISLDEATS